MAPPPANMPADRETVETLVDISARARATSSWIRMEALLSRSLINSPSERSLASIGDPPAWSTNLKEAGGQESERKGAAEHQRRLPASKVLQVADDLVDIAFA